MTRHYIPDVIDRLEELTAGKFGVRLRKPQNSSPDDTDEIDKAVPDSREPADQPSDQLSDEEMDTLLTSSAVEAEFENIFNTIYGSQVMVLKRLSKHIPEGLAEDQLIDLYKSHTESSSNPYPSFEHFIQYLDDTVLTLYDIDEKRYKLTNSGLYFLRYLQKTNRYSIIPRN